MVRCSKAIGRTRPSGSKYFFPNSEPALGALDNHVDELGALTVAVNRHVHARLVGGFLGDEAAGEGEEVEKGSGKRGLRLSMIAAAVRWRGVEKRRPF